VLEHGLLEILELVDRGAGTADALARASGLDPGTLATGLVRLELAGYVRRNGNGCYERTSLAVPNRV
jgi:DNA-binding IclR family transcriptional regulator